MIKVRAAILVIAVAFPSGICFAEDILLPPTEQLYDIDLPFGADFALDDFDVQEVTIEGKPFMSLQDTERNSTIQNILIESDQRDEASREETRSMRTKFKDIIKEDSKTATIRIEILFDNFSLDGQVKFLKNSFTLSESGRVSIDKLSRLIDGIYYCSGSDRSNPECFRLGTP